MRVSEFARAIHVSEAAVRKAARNGRLSRSVTWDGKGRILDIDSALGLREWEGNRTKPAPPGTRPAPSGPAGVTEQVAALVSSEFADVESYVLALVPAVVEGAAAALRQAGRGDSDEEIAAALRLEEEVGRVELAVALMSLATREEGGPRWREAALEAARGIGRGAVHGEGRDE